MATTVAEIGKLAGCSGATVSRVLNNRGYVNPEMRHAVIEVLDRVKYRVGRRGRPLGAVKAVPPVNLVELLYFRDRPMEHLSILGGKVSVANSNDMSGEEFFAPANELSGSFYRRVADGVVGELTRWGMRGVLEFTTNLGTAEAIARVNKPDRAGVLLLGEYSSSLSSFVKACTHPVVLVDVCQEDVAGDVVTFDNYAGISDGFDHLYALGHRRIGYVGRRTTSAAWRERFAAFKVKMVEADLPIRQEWIGDGRCRIDEAEEATHRILGLTDRPTALMCGNDVDAMGVYRAAAALNIRIPDQLSVIGFDDQESASLVTPALTTVRTPMVELGAQSVRQLMLQIRHPQSSLCHVRLVPKLVVRGSTRSVAS